MTNGTVLVTGHAVYLFLNWRFATLKLEIASLNQGSDCQFKVALASSKWRIAWSKISDDSMVLKGHWQYGDNFCFLKTFIRTWSEQAFTYVFP